LTELGWDIISSGGTAKTLKENKKWEGYSRE
jgi:AICAR transformylase/IMP cyclohydrolase PurH